MTRRLFSIITDFLTRRSAQRDVDNLLARLPTFIEGNLRPCLPSDWRLQVLRRVEPIDLLEDGSVRFSGDVTEAARDLGFLDE